MAFDAAALKEELADLKNYFPAMPQDDLFNLWFVWAYLDDDLRRAADSICGGPGDKTIDAVHIDHDAERVGIVQGKYAWGMNGREGRGSVMSFAKLAPTLLDDSSFRRWSQGMAPAVTERLKAARRVISRNHYGLTLYYVTLRQISVKLRETATRAAKQPNTSLMIFGRSDVGDLFRDYLDGVSPPVPTVNMRIETTPASGIIKRFDRATGITSWIFSCRTSDIASLFNKYGRKIFARNIRASLGAGDEQSVNRAIRRTLRNDPAHFWYFNNGITIACDEATQVDTGGRLYLEVANPQIVNGLQTTVALAEADTRVQASVLVRVIALPKSQLSLVDQVVRATNRQNPIRPSDLMSNDRIQVYLERKLRLRNYVYVRKRGRAAEAKALMGNQRRAVITKLELAQAVAACELDPSIARSARESLFDDEHYARIFHREGLDFYLCRWWVVRQIARYLRGSNFTRKYMKFFVAHAIWDWIGTDIWQFRSQFIGSCEMNRESESPLAELRILIDRTYRGVERFFRNTRRENGAELTVGAFFKRSGKYAEYLKFMDEAPQAVLSDRLSRAAEAFSTALAEE